MRTMSAVGRTQSLLYKDHVWGTWRPTLDRPEVRFFHAQICPCLHALERPVLSYRSFYHELATVALLHKEQGFAGLTLMEFAVKLGFGEFYEFR